MKIALHKIPDEHAKDIINKIYSTDKTKNIVPFTTRSYLYCLSQAYTCYKSIDFEWINENMT